MSRNGSGGYSLPVNTWNPATTGVSATVPDWQTLINDIATAIQQSVSADGQTPITGNIAMGNNKLTGLAAGSATGHSLRWEQLFSQGTIANLASATATDIGAQNTSFLNITGTTTITGFGTNYNGPRYLVFAGILTLTHSATLVCPGAANITTAANDSAIAIPISGGWQIVAYQKASGLPVSTTGLVSAGLATASGLTMSTARVLGRTTASTGAIEELTAAQIAAFTSAATDTAQGAVELLTAAEAQAGTDTTRAMTAVAMKAAQIQPQTAVTLTTQTAVDFTSIPSWVNRISLHFSGVSTNGTSVPIVQLGDAGGFETSGYTGNVSVGSNGVAWTVGATPASGFGLSTSNAAGSVYTGKLVLDRINGNEWVASGDWAQTTATISTHLLTGAKTLSATLTQIRLTTVGGSDQFDAGTVNVSYE